MKTTSQHPLRGGLLRTITRTTVFLAVAIVSQVVAAIDPTETANIGLGIAIFAVVVAIAFVWGLIDGKRYSFVTGALPWLPIAALTAVLNILTTAVAERIYIGDLTSSIFSSLPLYYDLLPFFFGLVLFPALAGVGLGQAFRRPSSQTQTAEPTAG